MLPPTALGGGEDGDHLCGGLSTGVLTRAVQQGGSAQTDVLEDALWRQCSAQPGEGESPR